jgi:hypothetical protein
MTKTSSREKCEVIVYVPRRSGPTLQRKCYHLAGCGALRARDTRAIMFNGRKPYWRRLTQMEAEKLGWKPCGRCVVASLRACLLDRRRKARVREWLLRSNIEK